MNASANQMRDYVKKHNMLTGYKPGPYDAFYGYVEVSSYEKLVAISTEPYMYVDFVTDGFVTEMGFTVSLNLRPTSM